MFFVFIQLNGINYRGWNQVMKIALGAKKKLRFIEGKMAMPKKGSKDYGGGEDATT